MNKFEEYLSMAKISDFIHRKELEDEKKKTVCLVFAIIAGIAAIAAIAFGILKLLRINMRIRYSMSQMSCSSHSISTCSGNRD